MNTAITKTNGTAPITHRFSQEQRKLILDTCCGGASAQDAAVLVAIAEARGMNPLAQECYFVERWDQSKGRMVWAVQAGIDSFRIKAEESGLYNGQDEPEFEYDAKGALVLARVKVYRKDWDRPSVGVARFSEYVQKKKDGSPTKFWLTMPHGQLAKCAEAIALRKAFPRSLSRIYEAAEMQQAGNEEHVEQPAQADPEALYRRRFDELTAATTEAAFKEVTQAIASDKRGVLLTKAHLDELHLLAKQIKARLLAGKIRPAQDEPHDPEPPADVELEGDREPGQEG